jgi:hypothetical protein
MADVVVYQQLYAPYEVYVRPLDMFMSKVGEGYRFEKIVPKQEENKEAKQEIKPEVNKPQKQEQHQGQEHENEAQAELELDPGLIDFLDANTYEKKLEILSMLHPRITDDMINTMAVSLDTEVKEGDIETRYSEIKGCLLTLERFECNRLR